MKNFLIVIALSLFAFGNQGCIKDAVNTPCTDESPQDEQAAILAYANAKGYTVTAHPSGMYYQVTNPGSGAIPLDNSRVFIEYTGRLISSDAIFDQQTNSANTGWPLNTLIEGWRVGLPLIAVGGTIRLIIPSSMAYGCRGFGQIPGDAVLFFEIKLVAIQ